jgi:hypothetical protein
MLSCLADCVDAADNDVHPIEAAKGARERKRALTGNKVEGCKSHAEARTAHPGPSRIPVRPDGALANPFNQEPRNCGPNCQARSEHEGRGKNVCHGQLPSYATVGERLTRSCCIQSGAESRRRILAQPDSYTGDGLLTFSLGWQQRAQALPEQLALRHSPSGWALWSKAPH